MAGMVITSVEMATPQWLTGRLRKSGALSTGTVTGVEVGAGTRQLVDQRPVAAALLIQGDG